MENAQNKRCLIGMPSASGLISAYVVDGLYKMNRPILTSLLIIERQAVDAARNYLLEVAIRMGVDYLFFIDDDGVLAPDTLDKLIEDDKDIVAAPMMTRNIRANGKHSLCCFQKHDVPIGNGKVINSYYPVEKFDTSKEYLHQVDAVGSACILIKKVVFEALFKKHNGRPYEFIHEVYEVENKKALLRNLSEDMCFSERAKEEGFEVWIDTRIRPVHLGKPKFVRFEQEGENWGELKDPDVKGALLSENLKSLD